MGLSDLEKDQFFSDYMKGKMEMRMQMNGNFDNILYANPHPKPLSSMAIPVMMNNDPIVADHAHPPLKYESPSFVNMRDHRSGECIADNRKFHNQDSSSYQFHEDLKYKEFQNQMGAPLTQNHLINVVNSSTSQKSFNQELVKFQVPNEPNSQHSKASNSSQDKEVDFSKEIVHLRARRGQATKKQSIYERNRRERIRERMNKLQDLVPGCKLVSGDIKRLETIICYIQSLQRQVQSLSMKLQMASMAPGNLGHSFGEEKSCQQAYMPLLPS